MIIQWLGTAGDVESEMGYSPFSGLMKAAASALMIAA